MQSRDPSEGKAKGCQWHRSRRIKRRCQQYFRSWKADGQVVLKCKPEGVGAPSSKLISTAKPSKFQKHGGTEKHRRPVEGRGGTGRHAGEVVKVCVRSRQSCSPASHPPSACSSWGEQENQHLPSWPAHRKAPGPTHSIPICWLVPPLSLLGRSQSHQTSGNVSVPGRKRKKTKTSKRKAESPER